MRLPGICCVQALADAERRAKEAERLKAAELLAAGKGATVVLRPVLRAESAWPEAEQYSSLPTCSLTKHQRRIVACLHMAPCQLESPGHTIV